MDVRLEPAFRRQVKFQISSESYDVTLSKAVGFCAKVWEGTCLWYSNTGLDRARNLSYRVIQDEVL